MTTVTYKYGTGNPIGSEDVKDGIDNLKSFDTFMNDSGDSYNQRDGEIVKTVHGMNSEFDGMIVDMNSEFDQQIQNMGYTRVGTFASGATLTNTRQTLLWDIADGGDGQEYGWAGSFLPSGKIVPPNSTPLTTGGISVGAWMSRFDPELRADVADTTQNTTIAQLASGYFPVGKVVSITDRAYGLFRVVDGGTPDGYGVLNAGVGKTATYVQDSDTIYLAQLVNAGTTDYTAALNYAIGITGIGSISSTRIAIPATGISVSDTIIINKSVSLVGIGKAATVVTFNNTVVNKPLFSFVRGSYYTTLENIWLADAIPGTSCAFKFMDATTLSGSPVLKLTFDRISANNFAIGEWYTTVTPLNGATHAHCAEVRWTNCLFSNNVVSIINENTQAVNIVHTNCDFENFDGGGVTDNQFTFFKLLGGGELKFYGGSIIGRGTIMQWQYPAGASGLFPGGRFLLEGARFELRAGKTGKIFEELTGGSGNSTFLELKASDCLILNQGSETLDLLTYSGRVNASFKDLKLTAGVMNIRNYPTTGRSANADIGSYGYVHAENCGPLAYIKETSSPYGAYSENYPHEVVVTGPGVWNTNASMAVDPLGFHSHLAGGNVNSMSQGITTRAEVGRIIWNSDQTTAGIAGSLKVKIPPHARPIKFFMYKHPQQFAVDPGFDLYLVKDNADWANPLVFAEATDAVLVATSASTLNKAGYFSYDVVLTNNVFGTKLRAGYASWLEGRMYFKKKGSNPFPGFVGVEYI